MVLYEVKPGHHYKEPIVLRHKCKTFDGEIVTLHLEVWDREDPIFILVLAEPPEGEFPDPCLEVK